MEKNLLNKFEYSSFYVKMVFIIKHNGLCMCSAGVKVRNFQLRTEPIRLFIISNFPSIVKDELAVLQQRAKAKITAETRIAYTLC